MSAEATVVFKAEYFLIGKKQKIKIDKTLTIGRGQVDCQIEDSKLSSTHCKVIVKGLRVFVVDLGSTNGTFLNGAALGPNIEAELRIGSELTIGSNSYIFSDKSELPKSTSGQGDQHVQAPFELKNLINFFNVHISWKIAYIGAALVMSSFYFFDRPDSVVPENLSFLVKFYHEALLIRIPFLIVAFYLSSLCHAYLNAHYFKKSNVLPGVTFLIVLLFQFFSTAMCFMSSGYTDLRSYLETRESIILHPNTNLTMSKYQNVLKNDFESLLDAVPGNYQQALKNDFEEIGKLATPK